MTTSACYFLLRLLKPKVIFLPLSLSFLFIFSMKALRSGRVFLAGFFATVVTFLILAIGVYCSIYFGVKPNGGYLIG
jgi:hypothetical protein